MTFVIKSLTSIKTAVPGRGYLEVSLQKTRRALAPCVRAQLPPGVPVASYDVAISTFNSGSIPNGAQVSTSLAVSSVLYFLDNGTVPGGT